MTDEFEKWYAENATIGCYEYYAEIRAAYSAGASAMREKCIKAIDDADDYTQSTHETCLEAISAIERVEI